MGWALKFPLRSTPWSKMGFEPTRKSPHQAKAETVSSKRSRHTSDPLEASSQAKHLLQKSGMNQCMI